MKNKKWTEHEIIQVKKLFESGNTKDEIGKQLNRTKRAIESLLSILGLLKSKQIWTEQEIISLKQYCKDNYRIKEIAQFITSKTANQIKSKIFKLGISYKSDYKLWTEYEISKLQELRKQNKSVKEIAKFLNRGEAAVEEKLYTEKIHLSDEFTCTKLNEEEKLIIVKYINNGLSCTKISKLMSRHPETIRRFCRCNDIHSKHSSMLKETETLKKNGERKCRMCLNVFEESYFNKRRNKTYCNECLGDARREKYLEKNNIGFQLEKFIKMKLSSAKTSAIKNKLAFDISTNDLLEIYKKQNGKCFYSGIEMELRRNDDFSLSIDKKNREFGYTKDNVVLCCWVINFMKNKIPIDSFIILCELISKNINNIPLNYESIYNKPMTPFSHITKSKYKI